MEWYIIIALAIAISIILFPVVYVWYITLGGVAKAVKEARLEVLMSLARKLRLPLLIIVPLAVYAIAIWLTLGNFGWPVALATGLVLPIVLIAPLLVWAVFASGIYMVLTNKMRRRVTATRRTPATLAEERIH